LCDSSFEDSSFDSSFWFSDSEEDSDDSLGLSDSYLSASEFSLFSSDGFSEDLSASYSLFSSD